MSIPAPPVRSQVVASLRDAILDFRFAPGQRLVERDLIEMFGVSRTTVREALGELRSEGLVVVEPHRGASVRVPTEAEAIELYEIRFRLETMVVERFAERATPAQLTELDAAIDGLAEAVDASASIHTLLDRRDEIFGVLLDGAESPMLRDFVIIAQARVNLLRATAIANRARLEASIDEWRQLAAACRSRSTALAAAIYLDHLRKASELALAAAREMTPPAVPPIRIARADD